MFLRIIKTGGRQVGKPVLVSGPRSSTVPGAPAEPGWVRAELFVPDRARSARRSATSRDTTYCRNKLGVTAMTSAIYVR